MASGHTKLADVIEPSDFSAYVQKVTEEKAKFVTSGILTRSAELDAFLRGGSATHNKPTWKDLDNDVEEVADETDPQLFGGTPATPAKIQTYNEIAVRLIRTKTWSAHKLQKYISGANAFAAIGSRVAYWEIRRLQAAAIAVFGGVFADNDAAPTGSDTHVAGDMTFDASGGGYIAGTTDFTAENLFDAQQTMGDSQGDLKILLIHSVVYNRMKKNNLIDSIQDSVTGATLETFQGLRVVYDDGLPRTGQVYTSYLAAPGQVEMGVGVIDNDKGTEVVWLPDAGKGIGAELLYRRFMWCLHPMGHAFIGTPASKGGPPNGDAATANSLGHAASWSRRCPERKQVKLARLITREA